MTNDSTDGLCHLRLSRFRHPWVVGTYDNGAAAPVFESAWSNLAAALDHYTRNSFEPARVVAVRYPRAVIENTVSGERFHLPEEIKIAKEAAATYGRVGA